MSRREQLERIVYNDFHEYDNSPRKKVLDAIEALFPTWAKVEDGPGCYEGANTQGRKLKEYRNNNG